MKYLRNNSNNLLDNFKGQHKNSNQNAHINNPNKENKAYNTVYSN